MHGTPDRDATRARAALSSPLFRVRVSDALSLWFVTRSHARVRARARRRPRTFAGAQVEFKVQDKMEGDVYVYYQLKNFYQNHRTYVKSRSDKQLLGTELEKDEMDDCLPRKYAKVRARAAAPPSDARAARNL